MSLPGSDTDQEVAVRVLGCEDTTISDGRESPSQQSASTSAAAQDDDPSESPGSSIADRTAPRTAASAAISDIPSAHDSRASSLAGSHSIAAHGSTVSLGSASLSSRPETQHRIVRAASPVATTTAVGQSLGTTAYSRGTETSAVRDEAPRARSPHNRRARGQERVLSYLSEASHLSTLTAFGEDMGVPEPPSPTAWSPACQRRVDLLMRIAFCSFSVGSERKERGARNGADEKRTLPKLDGGGPGEDRTIGSLDMMVVSVMARLCFLHNGSVIGLGAKFWSQFVNAITEFIDLSPLGGIVSQKLVSDLPLRIGLGIGRIRPALPRPGTLTCFAHVRRQLVLWTLKTNALYWNPDETIPSPQEFIGLPANSFDPPEGLVFSYSPGDDIPFREAEKKDWIVNNILPLIEIQDISVGIRLQDPTLSQELELVGHL
ncbi:hypothetical protein QBC37DRAFT_456062 [Rhypophila decipiens]|uniref:Uncharacterized protein n=1 Tax=Rhypophila decipiens TaxID=261697 RepID=A0AAN6XVB9_9PEZI|nr:hypothetical protein QBC37DRAFT_456062 [Rhypophila decipiens]